MIADGCSLNDRILSSKGVDRYGLVLSKHFETAWKKKNTEGKQSFQQFTLSWPLFFHFLNMFCKFWRHKEIYMYCLLKFKNERLLYILSKVNLQNCDCLCRRKRVLIFFHKLILFLNFVWLINLKNIYISYRPTRQEIQAPFQGQWLFAD